MKSGNRGPSDFGMCGWRVRSEFDLPELLPWQGNDRAPDLCIRRAASITFTDDILLDAAWLKIARDGRCLLSVPGVANYLVSADGTDIAIVPIMAADAPDIRVFLLGSVLGIVCIKRGTLPLHGSCVQFGDAAIVFCGPSGVGKSTLAAALLRRGHTVLADDIAVLEPDAAGRSHVLPSFPRLKLWRDAMDGLGLSTSGLLRSREGLEKFQLSLDRAFSARSLPIAALYHLETVPDARYEGISPLNGLHGVQRLFDAVYRTRTVAALVGGEARALALSTQIAGTIPSHRRLARTHDLGRLDDLVEGLARRHGGPDSGSR